MSTFSINGLLTIYGKKELSRENGHTATDWYAYIDGELVASSENDEVNLVEWRVGLIGNDGKPYDGTNGVPIGRVRIHVNRGVSEDFYLICRPQLSVVDTHMPYLMRAKELPKEIKLILSRSIPELDTGIVETDRFTAVTISPKVSIYVNKHLTKSE